MKELLEHLSKLRGHRIGVFGDLIADEYVYGTIRRFSREAPVFIVNYEDSQIAPGGAANAINNVHELGGRAIPYGIIGNDRPGQTLLSVLKEKGISVDGIVSNNVHSTFVKQRIVAGSPHSVKQQILRIDRCQPIPSDAPSLNELESRVLSSLAQLDAFVVSDYDLGVASPARMGRIIEAVKRRGIPFLVDSRRNLGAYQGISAATPNEPEVEALIGRQLEGDNDGLIKAGKELLERLQAQAILITRGKSGMALFTRDHDPVMIPIFGSSEIVDVTGAGDTVISTFALALSAGLSYEQAARLANCAAGIVVMKRGAATLTQEELADAIRVDSMHA